MIKFKKWKLVMVGIAVIFATAVMFVLLYINNIGIDNIKLMYKLHTTDQQIVRMSDSDGPDNQYLALRDSNDIELLIERMNKHKWTYIEQEGNGYFFEKNNQTIVVNVTIWNRNYILYKVQNNVVNIEG